MSLFILKNLIRQPYNPYLPLSIQNRGTEVAEAMSRSVCVGASFLQTTQSCSHLLLPTLAKWSSSQMVEQVLEANQEILQRLPIEAQPPTE